jgi:hypothetical protein
MVQLFVIEAGFTEGVTAGCYKQDNGAQSLFARGRPYQLYEFEYFVAQDEEPELRAMMTASFADFNS